MARRYAGKLGLPDGMIAVAGIAVSLWARPEGWENGIRTAFRVVAQYQSVRLAVHWIHGLLIHSQPIVAVLTLTALVLSLRHGPSRPRRLASQPGFVACGAAALTMLIVGPLRFAANRSNLTPGLPLSVQARFYFADALTFQKAECGIAIAAAWMVLVLGGRWRTPPNVIDWCGQGFGIFWIVMILITWLGPLA